MKNIPLSIALLLSVCLSTGCSAGTATATAKPGVTRIVGKPGAAVKMIANVPTKNAVSTPIVVEVQLTADLDADEMSVAWSPSAGLQVLTPTTPSITSAVRKGKTYRNSVTVRADKEGVYHLGVAATLTTKGVRQARAFSFTVLVGTATQESKPTLDRDADQQLLESSPARENKPR